jgi:hypothetical protein
LKLLVVDRDDALAAMSRIETLIRERSGKPYQTFRGELRKWRRS